MLEHMMPLVDESWRIKLEWVKENGFSRLHGFWVLQEIVIPYVLARGVIPIFGYPLVINSAVYRFALLRCLVLGLVCFCAKRFHVWVTNLHNAIRDHLYLIGRRLDNFREDKDAIRILSEVDLAMQNANVDSESFVHDGEGFETGLRQRHVIRQDA